MIYHSVVGTDRPIGEYNLDGLDLVVERAVEDLRPVLGQFDSIVVTGMSGVVVGSPVALALRKPLVIIRKDDDNSHHGYGQVINKNQVGERALWLDDFVATGVTQGKVAKRLLDIGSKMEFSYMYKYRDLAPSTALGL